MCNTIQILQVHCESPLYHEVWSQIYKSVPRSALCLLCYTRPLWCVSVWYPRQRFVSPPYWLPALPWCKYWRFRMIGTSLIFMILSILEQGWLYVVVTFKDDAIKEWYDIICSITRSAVKIFITNVNKMCGWLWKALNVCLI